MVSGVLCLRKGCATSTAAYVILDLIPVAAAVSPSCCLHYVMHREQVEPVQHLYENIVSWSVGSQGLVMGGVRILIMCQHCVDL